MAFSISNWNIEPNRVWFVRLADTGSGISVGLYLSQADAEAQANRQANATTSGYGSDLPVTLTNDPGATVPVSLFQSSSSWHLAVSGQAGDGAKIFKVKEFVDLPEIDHPIYRNEDLIPLRAQAEIDAHTHAVIRGSVELGTHLPDVVSGQIASINSSRCGISMGQVTEHRITGEINRLTSSLEIASYLPLKR